jgi:nucleoside 2-deoxyribosyltransferase
MKIYLCAKFSEQDLMRAWKSILEDYDYIVTSRWIYAEEADLAIAGKTNAEMDLEDINKADVVISKTLNRGDMFTGGGRHIEFGYAYAKGKHLINVGGYESVFHKLPQVITVPTIYKAIPILDNLKNGETAL